MKQNRLSLSKTNARVQSINTRLYLYDHTTRWAATEYICSGAEEMMEEEAVEETEIALMNLYGCDILKSDGGPISWH